MNISAVDFIARPTSFVPDQDPREDSAEYIGIVALTYEDGSQEQIYRSPDYLPTPHAAVWDAKRAWRVKYCRHYFKQD